MSTGERVGLTGGMGMPALVEPQARGGVGAAGSGRRRRRAFSRMAAKRGVRVMMKGEGSVEMKVVTSDGRGVGGVGGVDGVGGFASMARMKRWTKAYASALAASLTARRVSYTVLLTEKEVSFFACLVRWA